MTQIQIPQRTERPSDSTYRKRRRTALLVLGLAVAAVLAVIFALPAVSDSGEPAGAGRTAAADGAESPDLADGGFEGAQAYASGKPGSADGALADGETLDPRRTGIPALDNLDRSLREAVRTAADDARADGVEILLTSGWRSVRMQEWLLEDGIATYGSKEAASQYVASPDRSSHVTGQAVDVGPFDAQLWLQDHGNAYGLCRAYENEGWHFELLTSPGGVCPPMVRDANAG